MLERILNGLRLKTKKPRELHSYDPTSPERILNGLHNYYGLQQDKLDELRQRGFINVKAGRGPLLRSGQYNVACVTFINPEKPKTVHLIEVMKQHDPIYGITSTLGLSEKEITEEELQKHLKKFDITIVSVDVASTVSKWKK